MRPLPLLIIVAGVVASVWAVFLSDRPFYTEADPIGNNQNDLYRNLLDAGLCNASASNAYDVISNNIHGKCNELATGLVRRDLSGDAAIDEANAACGTPEKARETNVKQSKFSKASSVVPAAIPEWEKECRGGVHRFVATPQVLNPYSFTGKCYIYNFDEATIGYSRLQWLNQNTLLEVITSFSNPITILYHSDSPIDLSRGFVALGIQPEQYQDTLGGIRTPITFRILSQGITPEVERAAEDTERREAQAQHKEELKNLGTPYYLTSPNNPNFVDPCRFIKLRSPAEDTDDNWAGLISASCHFEQGNDQYWRAKSCKIPRTEGSPKSYIMAARQYMSSACWASSDFSVELDSAGNGTMHLEFTPQ